MDRLDALLARPFAYWVRVSEPPRGLRRRILQRAAAHSRDNAYSGFLPDHLQAWNLPGRKSGMAELWRFRFSAILAPYHSGSLKLVM